MLKDRQGIAGYNADEENLSLIIYIINIQLVLFVNFNIIIFFFISLKNMGQEVLKTKTDFHTGLGAFFKYIDKDECAAAEPIVTMATNYSKIKVTNFCFKLIEFLV